MWHKKPVLPCPHQPPILILPAANGKSATASITVPIARRPACTAAACLAVSPASGATDTTTFVATATGFVADSALVYDFGLRLADGRTQYHTRGAADPAFSFAPRVLEAGQHTLFVCARDPTGTQACSDASVTVAAAAAPPTAADVSAVASSLTTAVAAGSTAALLSAVRQLSAVAATGGADAQAAAASTAETALGALSTLTADAGATVEDSLGAAAAGEGWWCGGGGLEGGLHSRQELPSGIPYLHPPAASHSAPQPPPSSPPCRPSPPLWPMAPSRCVWGAGGGRAIISLQRLIAHVPSALLHCPCPFSPMPPSSLPHRWQPPPSRRWWQPVGQWRPPPWTRCWTWLLPPARRWPRPPAAHGAACCRQPHPLLSRPLRWMPSLARLQWPTAPSPPCWPAWWVAGRGG